MSRKKILDTLIIMDFLVVVAARNNNRHVKKQAPYMLNTLELRTIAYMYARGVLFID